MQAKISDWLSSLLFFICIFMLPENYFQNAQKTIYALSILTKTSLSKLWRKNKDIGVCTIQVSMGFEQAVLSRNKAAVI